MHFKKVLGDIRAVRIQGAEGIALASAEAIKQLSREGKNYSELLKAKKQLLATRPTEPCMRNTLDFIFYTSCKSNFRQSISSNADNAIKHFTDAREKIQEFGSRKICNGDTIFTHCHSSTIISILKRAKQKGKRFNVLCTETRPLFQGRITAKELAKLRIPVTLFVDCASRLALKKASLMLIGADAITSEGKFINKIGSELFAEMAFLLDKPVYVATNSWKFDPQSLFGIAPKLEQRHKKEVWPNTPRGVDINNFAFEKVHPRLISSIISEMGVLMPSNFVEEVKLRNPWMGKI